VTNSAELGYGLLAVTETTEAMAIKTTAAPEWSADDRPTGPAITERPADARPAEEPAAGPQLRRGARQPAHGKSGGNRLLSVPAAPAVAATQTTASVATTKAPAVATTAMVPTETTATVPTETTATVCTETTATVPTDAA